ncbi:hypothetical protein DVH05_025028 [Phytophthora capsici]|nr:hypothetical protein DVH05_025028 [Phytophthora capsici]
MRASAANHRRIVELRKKKPSSSSLVKSVAPSAAGLDPPVEQTAFIPDNEIVTVRFTFSRGRSRGTDNNTEQTDPSPLKMDGSDRDMMSLSGAFSPGVELESVLNDAAVGDTDRSQSPLVPGAEIPGDKSESNQSEPNTKDVTTRTGDSHDNEKIVQNMSEVAAESDVESAVKVGINGSEVTTILTQSDEGDESYGDNFDIEALPSAQAENQHDRLETSGYASEFEDGNVTPNVNPIIGDDDPEDEEEYSHDDFE